LDCESLIAGLVLRHFSFSQFQSPNVLTFKRVTPMSEQAYTLIVEVVDIQGHCPIYRVGDSFRIEEGYKLVSDRTVCLHALQAVCPYYVPLSRGISRADLGLTGPDRTAYVECLDPQRYTGGGTVTFRIVAEERGASERYPKSEFSIPNSEIH
jgi:uncharacterized repeat protein (TIGR04076 family)